MELPLAPSSQQVLEANNGFLKKVIRRMTEYQRGRLHFEYHAEAIHHVMNVLPLAGPMSPWTVLGHSSGDLKVLLRSLPKEVVWQARARLRSRRTIRKLTLRIRMKFSPTILREVMITWVGAVLSPSPTKTVLQ